MKRLAPAIDTANAEPAQGFGEERIRLKLPRRPVAMQEGIQARLLTKE